MGVERLPVGAHEKRRNRSFDGGHPSGCFRIARRNAIPDSPDVFPGLPAHAIEECELQVVGLVSVPAVAKCSPCGEVSSHLYLIHCGDERDIYIGPRSERSRPALHRRARLLAQTRGDVRSCRRPAECQRHSVLGVAVDSVRADFRHQAGDGLSPGHPRIRVPWSHIIMGNSTRTPRRWKSAII